MFFPTPLELSREAEEEILGAKALQDGENVEFTWSSLSMDLKRLPSELDEWLDGEPQRILLRRDEYLTIGESTLPIGRIQTAVDSALVDDREATRATLSTGASVELRLSPGDSNRGRRKLIS